MLLTLILALMFTIIILRSWAIPIVIAVALYLVRNKIKLKLRRVKARRVVIPVVKHINIDKLTVVDESKIEVLSVNNDSPYVIVRYGFFNITGISMLMLRIPLSNLEYLKTVISDSLRLGVRGGIVIIIDPSNSSELKIVSIVKSSRDTLPCGVLRKNITSELLSEVASSLKIVSSYFQNFKILNAAETSRMIKEVIA